MSKEKIKLELRFDVDQVTKALNYRFRDKDKKSIFREDGKCAGTFHFPIGGELEVAVIVDSLTEEEAQVCVMDFTLASVSTLPPATSDLSMFDIHSACSTVDHWGIPERQEKKKKTTIIISSRDRLPIVSDNGQWQISGYLSVLIERKRDGKKQKTSRVFFFDPEGTTGSGGDPPGHS